MNSLRAAVTLLALLGGSFECCGAAGAPSSAEISRRNEETLLNYLRPALKSANKAARFEFVATSCNADSGTTVQFPKINVDPTTSAGESGMAAVRDLFRNEHTVQITEGRAGVVRIRIGRVPDAILGTNISFLSLTPEDQFNPEDALDAILNNRDVQANMRRLRVDTPLMITDHIVVSPARGIPHLPSSVRNITMGEALDAVAKTFQGIVLYGACEKPALFDVGFASGGATSLDK